MQCASHRVEVTGGILKQHLSVENSDKVVMKECNTYKIIDATRMLDKMADDSGMADTGFPVQVDSRLLSSCLCSCLIA